MLKVRENHEMGRKGDCFWLSPSMCWFGEDMAAAPEGHRCRHKVGDGSRIWSVEVESCRRMIKGFIVSPDVSWEYIRYFSIWI